ncbi:MAG: hypothetical protein HY565_01100 [Candidatus Kerfeldbacteria bacterium]|nr:hypothetical protein [Candidatus Kerfeldbacteria bacterium]
MELQLAKKNKTVVVPTADDTSATVTGTVEATGVVADTDAVTTDTTAVPTDTTTATTGQLNIDQALNSLNMGNPTWDLFLVGFFVVGALLYGLSLGKDRIIAIMVSIYMALAVVAALPEFVLNIKVNDSYTVQITAFLSVFIVLFFLLSRQAVLNALAPSGEGKWWQTLVFSVLHVGLLVSVTLSFMPASILGKFSSLTQYIFTNEWTNFGWIAAPIVAMILIGRNRE